MDCTEGKQAESRETVIRTGCTYDCGGRCPLLVHVKDGVVTRIEGVAEGPYRACLRGRANRQELYSPDRLKYPLRRVGERGEGRFERITWDEALDTVARELKRVKEKYGNSAIFFSVFGGSHGSLHGGGPVARLLNMFGGFTGAWGNISSQSAIFGSFTTYGSMTTGKTRDDHLHSRLIILWGWNPVDTIFDTGTSFALIKAKEAGTRFVCVDPRFTNSAAVLADQWLPIVPGTDSAMLIAMAYTIIAENLHDRKFINAYTIGFEQYRDYVMGAADGTPKTPEWAEAITGVPAAAIRTLAREYATNRPAALMAGWGPGRTAHGEQFHRAAAVLAAITGNMGIPGGNAPGWGGAFPMYKTMGALRWGRSVLRDKGRKPIIPGYHEATTTRVHSCLLWDSFVGGRAAGYPFDIKLLYVAGGNPLNQQADTNRGVEALKKLEFVVVHEQRLTATARFADIVLPINTFMEREDASGAWLGEPYYTYSNRCVDSLYESRTDLQICTELAIRLGIDHYSDKTEEEWLKELLGDGVPDFPEFKRKGVYTARLDESHIAFKEQITNPASHPFPTPSGKIEIYSSVIAGIDRPEIPPIPEYLEGPEGRHDPLAQKYPLQMIISHPWQRAHSHLEDVPWLKEIEPHALWINPVDARARGIANGDEARIFNDRGAMIIPCRVTERIMPGVVHLTEGVSFRPDESGVDRGGCANVLTASRHTPAGCFPCNSLLVQVEKA